MLKVTDDIIVTFSEGHELRNNNVPKKNLTQFPFQVEINNFQKLADLTPMKILGSCYFKENELYISSGGILMKPVVITNTQGIWGFNLETKELDRMDEKNLLK